MNSQRFTATCAADSLVPNVPEIKFQVRTKQTEQVHDYSIQEAPERADIKFVASSQVALVIVVKNIYVSFLTYLHGCLSL